MTDLPIRGLILPILRVIDAYRELGPDGDFDRVLERAIGQLLDVPVLDAAAPLRQKTVTFAFAVCKNTWVCDRRPSPTSKYPGRCYC